MYSPHSTQHSKQTPFSPFNFGATTPAILLPVQFSDATFLREGDDLIIKFHDQTMVIDDYFISPTPLVTTDGIKLAITEVIALSDQPTQQLMLAENGTADVPTTHSAQSKIGTVEMTVEGPVTAQNQAGVSRTLQQGDAIYLHDTLITNNRSYIKITLNDGSLFQLGPLSRATLDKYSYNPDKPQAGGEFETSVTAGIFRFISGKISGDNQGEHTTIKTPAANIGIRGSEIDGTVEDNGATTILHTEGYIVIHSLYLPKFVEVFEPGTTIYVPATTALAMTVYHPGQEQIAYIRELLLPLNERGNFTSFAEASPNNEGVPGERDHGSIGDPNQGPPPPPNFDTLAAVNPFTQDHKMPPADPNHGRGHSPFEMGGHPPGHGEPPDAPFGARGRLEGDEARPPGDFPGPTQVAELPPQRPVPETDSGEDVTTATDPAVSKTPPDEEELPTFYGFNEDNSIVIYLELPPEEKVWDLDILSPRYGSVMNNWDGSVTYTPHSGFSGEDSFGYRLPEAGITLRANQYTMVSVQVEPLTISLPADALYQQPLYGRLIVDNEDRLIYVPSENYHGRDKFSYSLDGKTTTIDIQLAAVNDAPIAQSDIDIGLITDEDTSLTINAVSLLSNDSDPDGDVLSVHITSSVNSIVTVNADGNLSYVPYLNFNGQDSFSYFLEDSFGVRSDTATVSVTVNPVNDAPIVGNETFLSDTSLVISVDQLLANDRDIEGDRLTITEVLNPVNGFVIFDTANGTITFTPITSSMNSRFEYRVSDGQASSLGQVEIISSPSGATPPIGDEPNIPSIIEDPVMVNRIPVATADTIIFSRTTPVLTIEAEQLLQNDSDPDGNLLNLTGVSAAPLEGVVVLDKVANQVIFTPSADFVTTQTAQFSYTISDSKGGNATATVTVVPSNELPVAMDDQLRVAVDQATAIPNSLLTENDTDTDGDSLVVTEVELTESTYGTVVLDSATNQIIFTPTEAFAEVGQADFSYLINDGYGGSSHATVTLTANYAPIAVNERFNLSAVDQAITVTVADLLENDSDPNLEDILTIVAVHDPLQGEVFFNADQGEITFTPNAEFAASGQGQLTYTVSDNYGATSTAIVSFQFDQPNSAPEPQQDEFILTDEGPRVFTQAELLQNDTDPNHDSLTIISVANPLNGQVSFNETTQQITFIPTADFTTSGEGRFVYTVADSQGATAESIVIVKAGDIVDAVDDELTVTTAAEQFTIAIADLLENDSSRLNNPLSISEVSEAVKGEVSLDADNGVIIFTPAADFTTGQFTYTVTNAQGDTATATVTLTGNAPPLAQGDDFLVEKNTPLVIKAAELIANDADPEGDELVIESVGTPEQGTVTINAAGDVEYTPKSDFVGTDQFEYTIHDGHGGKSSGMVTLKIEVANTLPDAKDDGEAEFNNVTSMNTSLTIATADLLANDSDADGDPLTITAVTSANNGNVTLSGETIDYSPDRDFVGEDQFTYTVDDGRGGTDTATVTVMVEKMSLEAVDDDLSLSFNAPVVISTAALLDNDKSANNDLTVTAVQADANSVVDVRLVGDEVLIFVDALASNQFDAISFDYTVTSATQGSDSATVNLTASNIIRGTSAADTLQGTENADVILGDAGDDTFMPSISGDKLFGESGNDTFLFSPNSAYGLLINGGEGNDTLRLEGEGQFLDLFNNRVLESEQLTLSGIDTIHLATNNQLKLGIADVLEISDNGRLVIEGDAGGGSLVTTLAQDWTTRDSVTLNGVSYSRYSGNDGELLVSPDVFVLII